MTTTLGPNLGILIDAAVGDSHPNEFRKVLRALDCFLPNLSVKSKTTTAQPVSPSDGDRYIIPSGATGAAWSGKADGTVTYYSTHLTTTSGGTDTTTSGWEFYTPKLNWLALVEDESNASKRWSGSAWV